MQLYAGFNIVMLYVYQLPIKFPNILKWVAEFIGLFKITANSDWTEICSSISVVIFYVMVCLSLNNSSCHLTYCSSGLVVIYLQFLTISLLAGS